jgi:phosphoglycerate dehydrogenase-like enzyme
MDHSKDLLIIAPYPQKTSRIFSDADLAYLDTLLTVKNLGDDTIDYDEIDVLLPDAFAVIGQFDLPEDRLKRAGKLKAVFNIEGNFAQNIDYAYCFKHNIHVLNCGEAFALPVAEMALGFALDAARQITQVDKDFRVLREGYLAEACTQSVLLSGASVGFIGLGLIGRHLRKLLEPFACSVKVFDPWLPDSVVRQYSAEPASLESVLSDSQFIFVLAASTAENGNMLDREKLSLITEGSCFMLVSRAAVVDFDALTECLLQRRFTAAVDVFPQEPLPEDHPIRSADNVILSSHRAGAIPQAYRKIGEMVIDDLRQLLKGLPPVVLQDAKWETVQRFRNKPSA